MLAVEQGKSVYGALGRLLEYPSPGTASQVRRLAEELADEAPAAAEALHAFAQEIAGMLFEAQEEAYSHAFDISPQCIPYLSVHLFGEDNHKRAELMCGLKDTYEAAGFAYAPELPDHLSVVLRFAAHFAESVWDELVRWCMPGPLKAMAAGLSQSRNPYRHVIAALRAVFAARYPGEFKS